ncbi:hypothetical protein EDM59_02525 [Brevibacillus nitrificans]|uniref:Isoprenylcysteine carboxyl methyltransferase n=1 Tax=Brevibacillus nitrificans TaxID=651560 RepID=A0A3M8DIS8_9BACL|nr:isoprenylcysteine carboxylmethyltransferase family protein [Brevibacillus nitrificans]RNB88022.1 hypothetical protein EDM59_02525 [Brevibacillus nitrificans]
MLFFWLTLTILVLQRACELLFAARNARIIRSLGGYEVGAEHYRYLVTLHVLFIASLICEVQLSPAPFTLPSWWPMTFAVFLAAQLLRYWCMWSLGSRWNTRILILPDTPPVRRGPYRYLRHPNYLVVAIELVSLPISFGAYFTALTFSLLNAWLLLRIRIPMEEKAVHRTED